jgi:hypothetical protein
VNTELTYRISRLNGHVPRHAWSTIGVRHEARVFATFHGFAGLSEGGLGSGMVLLHKLEFDDIADVRCNGFWVVSEDGCHSSCNWLQSSNYNLFAVRQRTLGRLKILPTVCVAGPLAAAGARLMTCIWAAARPATIGSALMYFIISI